MSASVVSPKWVKSNRSRGRGRRGGKSLLTMASYQNKQKINKNILSKKDKMNLFHATGIFLQQEFSCDKNKNTPKRIYFLDRNIQTDLLPVAVIY